MMKELRTNEGKHYDPMWTVLKWKLYVMNPRFVNLRFKGSNSVEVTSYSNSLEKRLSDIPKKCSCTKKEKYQDKKREDQIQDTRQNMPRTTQNIF